MNQAFNPAEPSPEELHLSLLQSIPEGMCFAGLDGRVRFWNDAAEAITGYSVAEAVCAIRLQDVFSLRGADGNPAAALEGSPEESSHTEHHFLQHKDGHHFPVRLRRVPVRAVTGELIGALNLFAAPEGSAARAEARLNLEEEDGDRLTEGMNGGTALTSMLAENRSHSAGIVLIRIDGYDGISRRLGFEASGKLRALVDRTTAYCLKDQDSCARAREDSLLAVISGATEPGLQELCDRIRMLIQSSKIQWWGDRISITVSVGATLLRPHDASADALRRVEDCVAAASAEGGNRIVFR